MIRAEAVIINITETNPDKQRLVTDEMAAHQVSDTRVTGANYEAHYPLIRGQFVKQIKAVCDIDCQNIQHSFQLLFLLTEICRERYFACLPTLSSMCLVIRRVLETEAAESLVLYIRCREQRVTNKRTMNVQGFLNYQLLLHLECILRVTCRRNKYYKHFFSFQLILRSCSNPEKSNFVTLLLLAYVNQLNFSHNFLLFLFGCCVLC